MFDLFTTVPEDLRRRRQQEYDAYLVDRDGELDMQAWTLSKREKAIAKYEAKPPATREIDAEEFARQYVNFDARKPPSQELALLLALVKVNAAEAYGVSRTFQQVMERALKAEDYSELRVLCEEGYHTRILLSSANLYGVEVKDAYTPPSALRVLIGGIATLPMSMARPLTLAAEIMATVMFTKLLHNVGQILKHAPEVRDAIEERLIEICVDERGHISYNRLHMGPAALAQARLILPMVARVMAKALPEVAATGAYPHDILQDLPLISDPKRMPEAVLRQSFVA